MSDGDLQMLESLLLERPERGPVMQGTGGVRKLRFSPPSWHRGKSGALRICYVWFSEFQTVYLLLLFPKNEKANLNAAERNRFRQWVNVLRQQLKEQKKLQFKQKKRSKPVVPPPPGGKLRPFARKLDQAFQEIFEGQVTIRHVEVPDPGDYTPASIRHVRRALGVSQSVFARLMGVSTVLVQSWEQGQRVPSPMARRLLDEISREPRRWAMTLRPVA